MGRCREPKLAPANRVRLRSDGAMINVKIGNEEKTFDGNPQWIQEHLDGRRRDGQNVCVRVSIKCRDVDMLLATPGCGGGAGGGRAPNGQEREIFELWDKFKLNTPNFTSGNLVAFLKQLGHICK
jgi:hypothetical protein